MPAPYQLTEPLVLSSGIVIMPQQDPDYEALARFGIDKASTALEICSRHITDAEFVPLSEYLISDEEVMFGIADIDDYVAAPESIKGII